MKLTISEIVALVLGSMLGLRMILSLIKPKNHRSVAFNLYNKKAVIPKRIFYVIVSLLCSFLLIKDTSIVYFVLAGFAIGAIWDFYNTLFQWPETSEIEELLDAGKPIPLYLSPRPKKNIIQALVIIGMVIWMYVDIFSKY
jgi:hypothetical protein